MTTGSPHDLANYRPAPPAGPPPRRPPPAGKRKVRRKRRGAPPPRKRRGVFAAVALWMLAGLVVITGGLAGAIYYYSPAELVRAELVRQVQASTGRTLAIRGTPSLTFYPSLGVSLPDVALSPPPGMTGAPTLRAEQLRVSVAVAPLLSQTVVIEEVGLVKPVIDLRVDRSGRQSWSFAAVTGNRKVAALPSAIGSYGRHTATDAGPVPAAFFAAQPGNGNGLELLDSLELKSVRITDGYIQYLDERNGEGEVLSGVDVRLNGRRIADPMTIGGGFVWNRQRVQLDARLETLRQLLSNQPAKSRISLKGKPVNAVFDGNITLGKTLKVAGQTKLDSASAQLLARWLGTDLPNAKPLGGVSIAGTLDATDSVVALNGATIKLGDTRATGAVSARLTGARPLVRANLKVAELDIDRLTAYFDGSKPVGRTKPKALAAGPQTPGAAQPRSIEDLLRGTATEGAGAGRFSPQVRGYTRSRGWDKKPIETSALKALDADARLLIAGLRVAGLAIGQTSLRATLNGGSARADIDDIALYGGRGRGVITARQSGKGLKVGLNISVSDVSAQPLLKDAAEIDMIAGRGRLTAALGSTGVSQQTLMSNLAGKAGFTFTDGAIIGWNIPQIMRGMQTWPVLQTLHEESRQRKTDFSELSANFKISRGIANTQDLRMSSPLLRMAGSRATQI